MKIFADIFNKRIFNSKILIQNLIIRSVKQAINRPDRFTFDQQIGGFQFQLSIIQNLLLTSCCAYIYQRLCTDIYY